MTASSVFYNRFPFLQFDKSEYRTGHLAVDGMPSTMYGHSSHTSPIEQNSSTYLNSAYNIAMLRNLRVEDKPICLTRIDLPPLQFKRADILKGRVKFCGVVQDTTTTLNLVVYHTIQVVSDDDDDSVDESHVFSTARPLQVIVNLPSSAHTTFAFNTNKFCFVTHAKDAKRINISASTTVNSWRTEQQRKRTRDQMQERTETVEARILANLRDLRDDHAFLLRIDKLIQKDPSCKNRQPSAAPADNANPRHDTDAMNNLLDLLIADNDNFIAND